MGCNRQIVFEIVVFGDKAQNVFAPDIAVFAYKPVVFAVFAEFCNAGCYYDKLAAVGELPYAYGIRLVPAMCSGFALVKVTNYLASGLFTYVRFFSWLSSPLHQNRCGSARTQHSVYKNIVSPGWLSRSEYST